MHVKRLKLLYIALYVALFPQVFVGEGTVIFWGCPWNGSNELFGSPPISEYLAVKTAKFGRGGVKCLPHLQIWRQGCLHTSKMNSTYLKTTTQNKEQPASSIKWGFGELVISRSVGYMTGNLMNLRCRDLVPELLALSFGASPCPSHLCSRHCPGPFHLTYPSLLLTRCLFLVT